MERTRPPTCTRGPVKGMAMQMKADGFDDAIIGTVERCGQTETVILYDKHKVIEILTRDMPLEDAVDYFEYNILGAYVGEGTPAFATLVEKKKRKTAPR